MDGVHGAGEVGRKEAGGEVEGAGTRADDVGGLSVEGVEIGTDGAHGLAIARGGICFRGQTHSESDFYEHWESSGISILATGI
jgi:hypothetical protein